jgi:hypothetical protein
MFTDYQKLEEKYANTIRCEAVVKEVWVDNEDGISVDKAVIEVPAALIGKRVEVIVW